MEQLDRRLLFLATVGSTAPFVGLFGTVWGIMTSFQAIAVSKNTNLAVVAPGIARRCSPPRSACWRPFRP
jgi:biopolymer transport protein TolQ